MKSISKQKTGITLQLTKTSFWGGSPSAGRELKDIVALHFSFTPPEMQAAHVLLGGKGKKVYIDLTLLESKLKAVLPWEGGDNP